MYCIAGFGSKSHWYQNLKSNPQLEMIMPGGAFYGEVEEVTDPEEATKILMQILINAGFAAIFEGYNPRTATPEKLQRTLDRVMMLRINQTGIGSGAYDPQGWLWIGLTVFTVTALYFLFR